MFEVEPNFYYARCVASSSEVESLIAEISIANTPTKVAMGYRTPSMSSNDNENFIKFYRDNLESSSRYIIIGDMNYPGINWETMTTSNANESKFIDFMTENALHQHVFEPTRAENILD